MYHIPWSVPTDFPLPCQLLHSMPGVGLGDKDCKAWRCFDENRKASLSLLAWQNCKAFKTSSWPLKNTLKNTWLFVQLPHFRPEMAISQANLPTSLSSNDSPSRKKRCSERLPFKFISMDTIKSFIAKSQMLQSCQREFSNKYCGWASKLLHQLIYRWFVQLILGVQPLKLVLSQPSLRAWDNGRSHVTMDSFRKVS